MHPATSRASLRAVAKIKFSHTLSSGAASFTRRGMASETRKCEWLVILPDQPDGYERRMKVRPEHIERVKTEASDNFWLLGGAMLTHPPAPDEKLPACGSAMLAYAASKEEVLARLKDDIYTTEQVWDWSKVQIWPFRSAVRSGIEGVS